GRVEQTAVDGRDDFAPGKRVDCRAHGGKQVNRNADGAVFQTLEVIYTLHRLLEPAKRLRVKRRVGERHDVGADRIVNLLKQLLAATVLVPGEQHIGVHPEARSGTPKRERGVLTIVIDEHTVTTVQNA